MDAEARAVVETLYEETHKFARDTVNEVEALHTTVHDLQEWPGQFDSILSQISGKVNKFNSYAEYGGSLVETIATVVEV